MAEPRALTSKLDRLPAAADLRAALRDWRAWLRHERRLSPHSLAAYESDLADFLSFQQEHNAGPPDLAGLDSLRPADFRAWLARRAGDGLSRGSNARAIATVRGLFRWLGRRGLVDASAATAVRTPRVPKALPRALRADEAAETVDLVSELATDDWIGKRDTAVLLLLYGCGLRIGEALSLTRAEAPAPGQPSLRVLGKGRKTRLVPLLPVVAQAVADAATLLDQLGARVNGVSLEFVQAQRTFETLWFGAARHRLSCLSPLERRHLDQNLVQATDSVASLGADDHIKAALRRAEIGFQAEQLLNDWDVLITPTVPVPAFEAGLETPDGAGRWTDWEAFNYPFNLSQQPACSVPCGFTESGLPIGLQIISRKYRDDLVLRVAAAYQVANPVAWPMTSPIMRAAE